jgi:hypothetical protein
MLYPVYNKNIFKVLVKCLNNLFEKSRSDTCLLKQALDRELQEIKNQKNKIGTIPVVFLTSYHNDAIYSLK